jgi:hypothetical protein
VLCLQGVVFAALSCWPATELLQAGRPFGIDDCAVAYANDKLTIPVREDGPHSSQYTFDPDKSYKCEQATSSTVVASLRTGT